MLLRPASIDDAAPLTRLHIACWREAYAGLLRADLLAEKLDNVDARIAGWRETLRTGAAVLLAESEDGELVGFAATGPGRDSLDPPLELYALYVRAGRYGTGLGAALIDAALGEAPASLWVLEGNARAEAFYAKHGFLATGERQFDEEYGVWDRRMVRR